MTSAPRTLINRLLLIAIAVMTLAIFALAGAIIWKLFIAEPMSALSEDPTRIDIGSAALSYRVPEGCEDQVSIFEGQIQLRFSGATCEGREIIEVSGNVTLLAE